MEKWFNGLQGLHKNCSKIAIKCLLESKMTDFSCLLGHAFLVTFFLVLLLMIDMSTEFHVANWFRSSRMCELRIVGSSNS